MTHDGRPMGIVAAIDLAATPGAPDLPDRGWLMVFYDFDFYDGEPMAFAHGSQIMHAEDVVPAEPPNEEVVFTETRVTAVRMPMVATGMYEDDTLQSADSDAAHEMSGAYSHQLLGGSRARSAVRGSCLTAG